MSKNEIKVDVLKEKIAPMLEQAKDLKLKVATYSEQLEKLAGEIRQREHDLSDGSGRVRQLLMSPDTEFKEEVVMQRVIENTKLKAEIAELVTERVNLEVTLDNAKGWLRDLTDKLARGLELDDEDDDDKDDEFRW